VSKRDLARVLGLLQSTTRAVPIVRPYLRSGYSLLRSLSRWTSLCPRRFQVEQHLTLALNKLLDPSSLAGRLWTRDEDVTARLATDASLWGWGAVGAGGRQARGTWSLADRCEPIAFLELKAVWLALLSLRHHLPQGGVLSLQVDNQAVLYMLRSGACRNPKYQPFIVRIHEWLHARRTTLVVSWIPSEKNVGPDRLSRLRCRHEWRLHPALFVWVSHVLAPRPLQIDRFASASATQLPRYNAWFLDPHCEAQDAFAQRWTDDYNYINPPWPLLGRVLRKLIAEKAKGVVVAPWWPGQSWWPLLQSITRTAVRIPPAAHLFAPATEAFEKTVGPPHFTTGIFVVDGARCRSSQGAHFTCRELPDRLSAMLGVVSR